MVTSFPTGQEAPGSVPGSFMGFFSIVLFHGMYGLGMCVSLSFVYILFYIFFGGGPWTLLSRSEKALQSRPCSYMWSNPDTTVSGIKANVKKKKKKKKKKKNEGPTVN